MFKKGHRPHNKGDDYVHSNYRNRPKNRMEGAEDEILEHQTPVRYGSGNPFRVDIDMRSLAMTKNNFRSDRVSLF